jgi:hypothetical protein
VNTDTEALRVELARLDALIEAEMRRMRARYELSLDEFRGLYITDERVESLLRGSPLPEPPPIPDVRASRATDATSRWHRVSSALDLNDDERDVLLVVLAPALDSKYEVLYAYLNDDVTRRAPTIDLAARLLGADHRDEAPIRAATLPSSRLFSTGAIGWLGESREVARGSRPLAVADPIPDWLRGLEYEDEHLIHVARPARSAPVIGIAGIHAGASRPLQGLIAALESGELSRPIVLSAPTDRHAAMVAEELFAQAGRPALIVDLAAAAAQQHVDRVFAPLELAQRLLGWGAIVTDAEALMDRESVRPEVLAALRRYALRAPNVIVATGGGTVAHAVADALQAVRLTLDELTPLERRDAWRASLAFATPGWSPGAVVSTLADRFLLGPDRILDGAVAGAEQARLEGSDVPSEEHLFAAARRASWGDAGGTTHVALTPFEWDDLVLPADVKARLEDIGRAIEARPLVLDEWGFSERLAGSRGVMVMFAGPSGTGKTMAAGILARTLHLDLHVIDLANVMSKYIGETEKNLDRAFDAARRSNGALLIDEADAILGKRSEVKDAHDRYGNVEVAYLLQKMEAHDGIVIVATNLAQNIDDAFSRRMQYVIEFPEPDETSRESLWRGMIPAQAPVDADLDFTYLARQFELTGGEIRNIVLDGAYAAARDGTAITLGHLVRAIVNQYLKDGRVPTPADFREHFELVATGGSSISNGNQAAVDR